jgi:hypothetical protein
VITGGRVTYAEVKKLKEEMAAGLSINVTIDGVEATKGLLEIKYTYVVSYEKDVATLKIQGVIEAKEDSPDRIVADWKKTQKLPDGFAEELLNAINFTCGANGTLIVRALNLAPPMVLPKIQISKEPGKAA